MNLMSPEEFNNKYKDLQVHVEKSVRANSRAYIDVVTNKNRNLTWFEIAGYDFYGITKACLSKYPDVLNDLKNTKPYYEAYLNNLKIKTAITVRVKNNIDKKTFKPLSVSKSEKQRIQKEFEIINGLYEIKKASTNFSFKKILYTGLACVGLVYTGIEFIAQFKNQQSGIYKIYLNEHTSEFKKLIEELCAA